MTAPDSCSTMSATLPKHSQSRAKEHFANREGKKKSLHQLTMLTQLLICVETSPPVFSHVQTYFYSTVVIRKNCSSSSQEPDTIQLMSLNFPSEGFLLPRSPHSFIQSVSRQQTWVLSRALYYALESTGLTKAHFPPLSCSLFIEGNKKSQQEMIGCWNQCVNTAKKHRRGAFKGDRKGGPKTGK